jgi:glycosyltransferase involved in cell wall biosynthesis
MTTESSVKSVLMLAPRMPWPENSGGEIRVASLLRHMARRYRFTLLILTTPEEQFLAEASAVMAEHRTGARIKLVVRSGPSPAPPGFPAIADGFRDTAMEKALTETAERERPDLIHLEFTQMAQYAEAAARWAPVILTEHDSSVLWPESTYHRGAGPDERERLTAFLRRAFAACARVVVVSQADADRLAPLSEAGKFAVVPTGVDLERFPFAPLEGRREGEAVFVGHYPHYPNEEAAVRLCGEIMPLLRARTPVRLRLVGSAPTPEVRALAAPDVEVVGEVADVAEHLRRARVFLAPMRLGFGIKGKILEAFACGTPVVASPSACEAMPGVEPGKHMLVGRDAAEFADAAARLLADAALSRQLAQRARAYVEERFGWPAQAELLDGVYRAALARGV